MKALILSGGAGTRLRPLTYVHAKQLIPLANKPTLFYIIEKIAKCGITDIGIIVGDTREEIIRATGNGERWNVRITYIFQPEPLGLAHAVKTAEDYIGGNDFIMALGDNAFNMELDRFIAGYYENNANTSLLLYKVKNPSQYGVAVVEGSRVVHLVEKPKEPPSDLIITGIYIFDHAIFKAIDATVPSARGELEITDAIQKQIEMGGKVCYELLTGWWKDTGRDQDMLEANRMVLDDAHASAESVPDEASVCSGKLITGKNVIIKNSTLIGPAAISDCTSVIDSYIGPYTSIGEKCFIENCELDNCIILEGSRIENITGRISGSLIGKEVLISQAGKRPFSNYFVVADNSRIYLK